MDALTTLKNFGVAFENAIGTEDTSNLLTSLTKFATECPDTMQELQTLVEENPDVFKNLLTRKGVMEVKDMIANISHLAPMLGTFGG